MDGAQALVVQMDTPGGLLESMKEIVKKMLAAKLPVIVFIAPSGSQATSAGAFITLAAHIAAMTPTSTIGAAHPRATRDDGPSSAGRRPENHGRKNCKRHHSLY